MPGTPDKADGGSGTHACSDCDIGLEPTQAGMLYMFPSCVSMSTKRQLGATSPLGRGLNDPRLAYCLF